MSCCSTDKCVHLHRPLDRQTVCGAAAQVSFILHFQGGEALIYQGSDLTPISPELCGMSRGCLCLPDVAGLFPSHSLYSAFPEAQSFTSRGWETSVKQLPLKKRRRDVCNTWPGAVCKGGELGGLSSESAQTSWGLKGSLSWFVT